MTEREASDWVVANYGFLCDLSRWIGAGRVHGSVEDAAQHHAISVLECLKRYDPSRGDVKPFVAGHVRRRHLDDVKAATAGKRSTRVRLASFDGDDAGLPYHGRTPRHHEDDVDDRDLVERVLTLLGPRFRMVAERFYLGGEKAVDVAADLGYGSATSMRNAFHGRVNTIRPQLERLVA